MRFTCVRRTGAQTIRCAATIPRSTSRTPRGHGSGCARRSPEKYEAYVDLVPGAWTKIKIEVRGEQARLYVHDQPQPTLVINDVKSGAKGSGAIALWAGPGTVAHFRNVKVTPAK